MVKINSKKTKKTKMSVKKNTSKKSIKKYTKKSGNKKYSNKSIKKSLNQVSKFNDKSKIIVGLKDPWLVLVKAGLKTVEGRLDYGIFRKIVVGNTITWKNTKDEVKTKVIKVTRYSTFNEMCYKEKYWKLIPGAASFKCAVDIYHKIFRKQQEARYGVVALELELVK